MTRYSILIGKHTQSDATLWFGSPYGERRNFFSLLLSFNVFMILKHSNFPFTQNCQFFLTFYSKWINISSKMCTIVKYLTCELHCYLLDTLVGWMMTIFHGRIPCFHEAT